MVSVKILHDLKNAFPIFHKLYPNIFSPKNFFVYEIISFAVNICVVTPPSFSREQPSHEWHRFCPCVQNRLIKLGDNQAELHYHLFNRLACQLRAWP